MKKLFILILMLFSIVLTSCFKKNNEHEDIIAPEITYKKEYQETTETFQNPDKGFYDALPYTILPEGIENINKYNYRFKYNSLIHLRMNISAFSKKNNNQKDLELTDKALSDLKTLLSIIDSKSSTVIIRFAYDNFDGKKDLEPEVSMILKHIESLCPIFNQFEKTITAVECGLIGPWGEMHSSAIATQETYNKLIKCYLDNTNNTIILCRRPKFVYEYYGYTLFNLDSFNVENNRLGVYNDGYLGSSSDLGTYTDRQKETDWLSKINNNIYYGGEVTMPNSEYNQLNNAQSEMFKLGLSYLNSSWNDTVINRWKNTLYTGNDDLYHNLTEYDYINNHMGYRLVMRNIEYSLENKLYFKLKLENVGFGNLIRKKKLYIIIKNDNYFYKEEIKEYDIYNLEYKLDISTLDKGEYSIYLSLCDEYDTDIVRAIRFANNDTWLDSIKSNKILDITI